MNASAPTAFPSPSEAASDDWKYAVCVAAGFIGRALQHWIEKCLCATTKCDQCAEHTGEEVRALVTLNRISELTVNNLSTAVEFISWEQGRYLRGMSRYGALISGTVALFIFHLLQPAFYFIVLWVYYDYLDFTQQWLGLVVAGRECVYMVLVFVALFIKPSFLLVDVRATWYILLGYILLVEIAA